MFKNMRISYIIFLYLILPGNLPAQNKIDFSISTIDNKRIELNKLYSKGPVLINFWALWCEPCKEEMRQLNKIYEKYKDRGFIILGINQDSPKSVSKVRAYIASHKIRYFVALDPDFQYLQKMNGQSIPYSLLFDTNGNIVYKNVGYLHGDEMKIDEEIRKLISGDQ
jgi:cytochrome c biogenesis protein CcmG, thiol:disulfide interchange protein DsbE